MTMMALNETWTTEEPPQNTSDDQILPGNCTYLFYLMKNNLTDFQFDDNHSCYLTWKSMLEIEEQMHGRGPPWWLHFFVQILFGLVCLIGLAGNTMVIYVVLRFSKMQTVTNLYIVNLAIADELFLIGIPFLVVTSAVGYWPFGWLTCKMYFITTGINQITSSMFLLIMSADRYLAVCHPITAPKWRTPVIAKVVAITAWGLSALLMVPIFMYANTQIQDSKPNCNIIWPNSNLMGISGDVIFTFYSFIFGFAIPLTLILAFYILVIMRLRTVGPKRKPISMEVETQQAQQQNSRAKERKRSHRKVTKLVLTVITVYFICWCPYWVTQMALVFMPQDADHADITIIYFLAGCLSYSNSAMNPILYAFLSDNFKKSFKKACSCAATKQDYTNTINNETSMFPRRKGSSYRRRKHSAPMTSATFAGTCPEMTMVATSLTRSTILNPSNSSLHQESPPMSLMNMNIPVTKLVADIDESDNDSGLNPPDILLTTASNPYTAILVHMNGNSSFGNGLAPTGGNVRKTSFSDLVTIVPPTPTTTSNTFVQENGVVVTAL